MAETLGELLDRLVRYWPLVVGSVLVILAVGETRWKLEGMTGEVQKLADKAEKAETDRKQWEVIARHTQDLAAVQEWRKGIDAVITPQGLQEWGYIKNLVLENKRRVDHLYELR